MIVLFLSSLIYILKNTLARTKLKQLGGSLRFYGNILYFSLSLYVEGLYVNVLVFLFFFFGTNCFEPYNIILISIYMQKFCRLQFL